MRERRTVQRPQVQGGMSGSTLKRDRGNRESEEAPSSVGDHASTRTGRGKHRKTTEASAVDNHNHDRRPHLPPTLGQGRGRNCDNGVIPNGSPGGLVDSLPVGLDEDEIPCDTLVAVNILKSQFPKLEKVLVEPFALRTQLYSLVSDRTTVDRQLEDLRCRGTIRVFKLSTGNDDHAVMLVQDYCSQVHAVKRRMEPKLPAEQTAAFDWFVDHVLSSSADLGIDHAELVELMSTSGQLVQDKHVSILMNAGFLVRQLADPNCYWFSMPNVGSVLKNLMQGRKELMSFLKHRKYNEILQSELEKRRLRHSNLGVRFHLRDLLGSDRVHMVKTTVGPLVRLTHY